QNSVEQTRRKKVNLRTTVVDFWNTSMVERRRDLVRRRLFELEREAAKLYGELATLRGSERLPGTYLLVDVGQQSMLLPASAVCEIVRVVDYTPLPNAPPHILGTFLYRGTVVVVIDLARYLGTAHEIPLDAHVIVLASSRPVALLADQVRTLVDSPTVAEAE